VDLVHGCTVNQPKGYPLQLIRALDLQSGGQGDLKVDVRRRTAEDCRRLAGVARSRALVHGFECGFDLREVEEHANLSSPKGWRLRRP
jgi:hypothetical protein